MDRKLIETGLLTLLALILAGGCAASNAVQKDALRQKYADDSAAARLPAVGSYLDRGQLTQARKTLNECLAENSDNPAVWVMEGRVLFAEGQIDNSRRAFDKAVALDSRYAEAYFYRGALEQSEDDAALALSNYQQAAALDTLNPNFRLAVAEMLILNDQRDQAVTLMVDGSSTFRNSETLAQAGSIAARCGDWDRAAEFYKKALTGKPHDSAVQESLADCYIVRKNWTAAADLYDDILKTANSDPVRKNGLIRLAMCRFNAGQYQQAWQCYDRLTVLDRQDVAGWIGMAHVSLGMGKTARARQEAQKAMNMSQSAEAVAIVGCADYLEKRYAQAMDSFSQLTSDEQLGGFAWLMIGRCHQQMGNADRADAAFQKAQQMRPDSVLIEKFLGEKTDMM